MRMLTGILFILMMFSSCTDESGETGVTFSNETAKDAEVNVSGPSASGSFKVPANGPIRLANATPTGGTDGSPLTVLSDEFGVGFIESISIRFECIGTLFYTFDESPTIDNPMLETGYTRIGDNGAGPELEYLITQSHLDSAN